MRLLISIVSILILSFSTLNAEKAEALTTNETLVNQELTFDGYEGDYYFFTDANFQAVVLESDQELPLDLVNGNYEGKSLNVAYEAVEASLDSSSEGIIKSVNVLE